MLRKKKRRRRKRLKYRKTYKFNKQDENFVRFEKLLQSIHSEIAQEIFGEIEKSVIGDWQIEMDGIKLFIDPVFGHQAEVSGTFNMPLFKRVKIHIWLLRAIRSGCSILKAVKQCRSVYRIQ